jgi:hypothetical protein
MSGVKVFISVGRTSTPAQEEFVSAVEKYMLSDGVEPLALGRNYWSSQQPLKAIDELMHQCSGAAIIAFERLRIVQAIDRRGSDAEAHIADVALPTVWNQVEAAMAYARGLPLLVLVQEELRTEGLLETGYDWYVKRMPLDAAAVSDREFCGIFKDWRSRVERFHTGRTPPPPVGRDADQIGSSPTSAARAEMPHQRSRRELRLLLESRFNDDELRTLCFDLGVDYENIPGETKAAKAMAIIAYFERMHRSEELMRCVRDLRPDDV